MNPQDLFFLYLLSQLVGLVYLTVLVFGYLSEYQKKENKK